MSFAAVAADVAVWVVGLAASVGGGAWLVPWVLRHAERAEAEEHCDENPQQDERCQSG